MVRTFRGARTSVWIMMKNFVLIQTCLFIVLCCSICYMEKIRYVSTERPVFLHTNPKYLSFLNGSSLRFGRRDPVYYFSVHFDSLYVFGNNVTLNLYFYEFMSNMRLRLFFELHYKVCDLLDKDKVLGPILKQGKLSGSCPYPSGPYHLSNLTLPISIIPPVLPFTKGRVYVNVTVTATNEVIGAGYLDMEIKIMRRESSKKN